MKLKKRKKVGRMRGSSTHGWGARKKHISSGNRGGFGMSGTGKTAGHRKTFIFKLYGPNYFGKQGITSRSTAKRDNQIMNVGDIEKNFEALKKKFANKDGVIDLSEYKILGDGEVKSKILIKAESASKSALDKIGRAGGKIILPESKKGKIEKEEKADKEN